MKNVKAGVSSAKRTMNVSKSKKKSDPIETAKKAMKDVKRQILREETEEVLKENKKHVFVPFIADECKADEAETKEILAINIKKGSKKELKEKKEKSPVVKEEKTKSPGVILSIKEFVEASGKKGISKQEILSKLIERFPERSAETMSTTVNTQIHGRIKEFFLIEKLENGAYRKVNK